MSVATLRGIYRNVSHFHENEALIAWIQTWKIIRWLTPERRRLILFIGAIFAGFAGLLSRHADWRDYRVGLTWLVPSIALPILLGLIYSLYLTAKHFHCLPIFVRRRPQICLHLFFWLMLLTIWLTPDVSELWKSVVVLLAVSFPYLIWRCGYMLLSGQRGKATTTRFRDHLFYIWPVWDGTNTPPGKGHDYLSRFEAQTTEGYARSFLAGMKLFALVLLWKMVLQVMGGVVYGDPKSSLTPLVAGHDLGVPRMKQIVSGDVAVPLVVTWLSLYLELIWETLSLAAKGHVWIGVLRLFGFHVFRNTYKPLLAESIVEFWNRYYFYFKELLVEFFFLPTYVRLNRRRPALRIVIAILAAAFVGNMYYHLLQAKHPLIAGDAAALWQLLGARVIYCFLLATGVAVSMLRQQSQRGKPASAVMTEGAARRVRRIAGVWTFFAVINYWNIVGISTISERVQLFFSLFGL